MRSAGPDSTARAAIRNTVPDLFAGPGPDAALVRQIAAAVGASPALIFHHSGGEKGLQQAVTDHVPGLNEESGQAEPPDDGRAMVPGDSLTADWMLAAMTAALPPRHRLEAGPGAVESRGFFARLFGG